MNEFKATPSRHLDVERLQAQLDTELLGNGNRIVYVPSVDSTNALAIKLAHDGCDEGIVVLTDSQTAGKGRHGRRWIDVSGQNILSSTVLRPLFSPYLLVMIASLAVVDAIAATCGIAATIKWPNDILIGESKVAGILIETSHDPSGRMVAIMGIGINTNGQSAHILEQAQAASLQAQPGLIATTKAITLEEATGHVVSRETAIAHLLHHIEVRYLALQQEVQERAIHGYGSISRLIREQWRDRLSTLGRTIQVRQGATFLSGVAEDVNDQGELLLRSHSGECISITWGDVGYPK